MFELCVGFVLGPPRPEARAVPDGGQAKGGRGVRGAHHTGI